MPKPRHPKRSPKKNKRSDSFTVTDNNTLLDQLFLAFPKKSRKMVKAVLRDGQVRVDDTIVTQFDTPLTNGQNVEVSWDRAPVSQHPDGLKIVHEDDHLIIIDKPPGLLTVATEKEKRKTAYAILSAYVKQTNPDNKIFIIHRLDRETSGLLMFARSKTVQEKMQKTWDSSISQRSYIAVVEGRVEQEEGRICSWLTESSAFIVYSSPNSQHGQKAVTLYKKLRENEHYTLLRINLETGRKHQIRVHMQDINHPVVGDSKYGNGHSPLRRLGLHAQVLAFIHPVDDKPYRFETAIPEKFNQLLARPREPRNL